MVNSSREAIPVASMVLFCRAGMRAASSRARKVIESSSAGVPHHFGLRVRVIRWAVRSTAETMNGPADGPGPASCPLLNASGSAVMALGSSMVLPANIPRHSG